MFGESYNNDPLMEDCNDLNSETEVIEAEYNYSKENQKMKINRLLKYKLEKLECENDLLEELIRIDRKQIKLLISLLPKHLKSQFEEDKYNG